MIHNEKKKKKKRKKKERRVSSLLASSRRRKEAEVKGATSGEKGNITAINTEMRGRSKK